MLQTLPTFKSKSPRELYNIAKTSGAWDPRNIPLVEDRSEWESLSSERREQLIKVCSLFYEGEISVADTLAWFLLAMPDGDRRMFLSSQIFEENKHAEFFELYFQAVLGNIETSQYLDLQPGYKDVLKDGLRKRGEAIGRAQIGGDQEALDLHLTLFTAHYMGIVEGVMAMGGYEFFDEVLGATRLFPRLHEGLKLVRADEGRHIAHGMDYLRSQLAEHPEYRAPVKELFLQSAKGIGSRLEFVFNPNPFHLDKERMISIANSLYEQRMREVGLVE